MGSTFIRDKKGLEHTLVSYSAEGNVTEVSVILELSGNWFSLPRDEKTETEWKLAQAYVDDLIDDGLDPFDCYKAWRDSKLEVMWP